jgi:hypothetical protein
MILLRMEVACGIGQPNTVDINCKSRAVSLDLRRKEGPTTKHRVEHDGPLERARLTRHRRRRLPQLVWKPRVAHAGSMKDARGLSL